jgi:hypothetical protein
MSADYSSQRVWDGIIQGLTSGAAGASVRLTHKSSSLSRAIASSQSKPRAYARMKSSPCWSAPGEVVNLLVRSSTCLFLTLTLHCSFRCSTIGVYSLTQLCFNGVHLCGGMGILRVSTRRAMGVSLAGAK